VRIFTVKSLAEHLEFRELYIRNLISSGKLRASKIGNSYRITEEAVLDFLEDTEIKGKGKVGITAKIVKGISNSTRSAKIIKGCNDSIRTAKVVNGCNNNNVVPCDDKKNI